MVRLQVVLVALERPDGLLIDRRLTVIAVRPNQVKAMRPRYRVAGGKSEGLDGFVLAELVRTEATASRCWCPTATRPRRFGA